MAIDHDIPRRADAVTTSMQLQTSIGNILGRPFHSLGTALLATRQVQKASNSAKYVWTPSTAQDQYFSTSLSSQDDPVSVAERVQQQTVEVPVPQILKKETVEVTDYVAAAPAFTYVAPAPVIEYVSSTPDGTSSAPAPVVEHAAPAPAFIHTAPAPVIEDVTPAPADSFSTPAPVIDFVAPSPIAQATSVTHVAPSERFSPGHTMTAVTTGVSLDTTGVVSPRCSTTAVEASGPQVYGSTSPGQICCACVQHHQASNRRPWLRQVQEIVRSHPHWQQIAFY